MTAKEETRHIRPEGCICDPFDLAAMGHMTNCPCWKEAPRRISNYLQQSHAAFQDMLRHEAKLLEEGWIFHEETQHWTHPDKPDTEIWRG
jgi:hypothetical protein